MLPTLCCAPHFLILAKNKVLNINSKGDLTGFPLKTESYKLAYNSLISYTSNKSKFLKFASRIFQCAHNKTK